MVEKVKLPGKNELSIKHNGQDYEIRSWSFEDGTIKVAAFDVRRGSIVKGTEKTVSAEIASEPHLKSAMVSNHVQAIKVTIMKSGKGPDDSVKVEVVTS